MINSLINKIRPTTLKMERAKINSRHECEMFCTLIPEINISALISIRKNGKKSKVVSSSRL